MTPQLAIERLKALADEMVAVSRCDFTCGPAECHRTATDLRFLLSKYEKLREALRPFAAMDVPGWEEDSSLTTAIPIKLFRAARSALGES